MAAKDLYSILGISKNATDKEIKEAYRKLAKQYHPDKNPGDKAAETRFKEVSEAYSVLSDSQKRQKYDQLSSMGFDYSQYQNHAGSTPAGGSADFNFDDFLSSFSFSQDFGSSGSGAGSSASDMDWDDLLSGFFGRSGRRRSATRRKPETIEIETAISLKQAFSGGFIKLGVPCRTREGKIRKKNIRVKVPPGVTNNSKLKLKAQGHESSAGGEDGDVVVIIKIRTDSQFRVEGRNLYIEREISLREALTGTELIIENFSGNIRVKVPQSCNYGTSLKVGGAGMPDASGGPRGDLFVKIQFKLPRITEEQDLESLKKILVRYE